MTLKIAAVVNLHSEGEAARPSIISAWRAVDTAKKKGIEAGLFLVLDTPTSETNEVAESWRNRGATVVPVDRGDLGAARNDAAQAVDAEWIAFLDADDLWGENWLTLAYSEATNAPASPTIDVWHPQVNVIFGDHHSLLHHVDSTSPEFSWARLRLHNSWTALSFVRRGHLLSLPYPRNELHAGFGFEDWSWNVEVLRRGGRHRVVPHTCHFIRRQERTNHTGTLLQQSQHALRTPYRNEGEVVHLAPDRLPGATSHISELTPVDADLPPTHRRLPASLSPEILEQARLAATIEPAIAGTVGIDAPSPLPQNTNKHVGRAQQALEELDLLAKGPSFSTHAELISRSELTSALDHNEQARVIAEVLLDPALAAIPRGESEGIDAAIDHFPQLRKATW